MDPNTKLLLDELKSVKSSLESSIGAVEKTLGGRIGVVESSLGAVERSIADCFIRLEDAVKVFDVWKPTVDASVAELRSGLEAVHKTDEAVTHMREEMTALRKTVSRAALESTPNAPTGVLPHPVAAAAATPVVNPIIGPSVGHGSVLNHRGFKGAYDFKPAPLTLPCTRLHRSLSSSHIGTDGSLLLGGTEEFRARHDQLGPQYSSSKLPKMDFPRFDGDNPKLWITNCDDYFGMYFVEPHRWIQVATMNCKAVAARWVQSLEPGIRQGSWADFCKLVMDRFGKNQYQQLIRKLFRIR